jgi:hypothetical protein
MANKDRTGTARQQRRRQREKEWLAAQGWISWEALHTSLMLGKIQLAPSGLVRDASSMTGGEMPADAAKHRRLAKAIPRVKKTVR